MSEQITDEELSKLTNRAKGAGNLVAKTIPGDEDVDPQDFVDLSRIYMHELSDGVPRLIAALQAERSENERLRGLHSEALEMMRYAVDPYKAPEMQAMFLRTALDLLKP